MRPAAAGLVSTGIQVAARVRGVPLVSVWGGCCGVTGRTVEQNSLMMPVSVTLGHIVRKITRADYQNKHQLEPGLQTPEITRTTLPKHRPNPSNGHNWGEYRLEPVHIVARKIDLSRAKKSQTDLKRVVKTPENPSHLAKYPRTTNFREKGLEPNIIFHE